MSRRKPFYVRCYVKKTGEQWVAVCVDLCLAAQSDTFNGARRELESQVRDYVLEALTVDVKHADVLLSRRAPLSNRIEYWIVRLFQVFHREPRAQRCAFEELVNPITAAA